MKANVWWIDPLLWVDGYVSVVIRTMEDGTIRRIERQAKNLSGQLVKEIIALDYAFALDRPQLMAFERMALIADCLEVSVYFVVDTLQEVDEMLECAV